jgi:PAS domain S-box-containing protein
MNKLQPLGRVAPVAVLLALALAAAGAAIELTRVTLEHNYRSQLASEAKRRAVDLMGQTMNGNVMGSISALGLLNPAVAEVARGSRSGADAQVMAALRAVGEANQADGVSLVNAAGVVQSSWDRAGPASTGLDVRFRPYFQIALQGRQNVYAAVGVAAGQRALYFSAPVRDGMAATAVPIGAAVARMPFGRIDALLDAWDGPALLLSPQQVTFASNRGELTGRRAGAGSPEQLAAIRALKQFGHAFERAAPAPLPFDVSRATVQAEGRRHALAHASVQWNDPGGDWSLVLLGDLDALMPLSLKIQIGFAAGLVVLLFGALWLFWRRRLRHAHLQRALAESSMNEYAAKLAADAASKSWVADVSADLQQAMSLADFAQRLMFHLAPRLPVDYGVLYAVEPDEALLVPAGGHGADPAGFAPIALGQGLVGQCARDLKPIEISDPAATAIEIVWGAGSARPRMVLLVPVAQPGSLLGVLVLAALQAIGAEQRRLLDAILPMVAMNLEILVRNLRTAALAQALQAQQSQLRDTKAWYRSLVESAPYGMLVVDADGLIVLANQQAHELFGYGHGQLVGLPLEVLVPPSARARHPALRHTYIESDKLRVMGSPSSHLRGARQDGSEFPIEVGLVSLAPGGGHGRCVCASVRASTVACAPEAG